MKIETSPKFAPQEHKEQTPLLEEGTLRPAEVGDMPDLANFHISSHDALNDALHKWHTRNGDKSSDDSSELKDSILSSAYSLASEVLSDEARNDLDLTSDIPDSSGFHHPPANEDARLLGNAWDVTRDPKLFEALRRTISEIQPKNEIASKKKDLLEAALNVDKDGNQTFTSTYNKALHDASKAFDIDEEITEPNVYIDVSKNSPAQSELGSMNDPNYHERMERLVDVRAMPFLHTVDMDGNSTIPAVHFRPDNKKK